MTDLKEPTTVYDTIRPYYNEEVNEVIRHYRSHPMFKTLLEFTFPDKKPEVIDNVLNNCHSIRDFQTQVIYHSVKNVVNKSSDGFSRSGFESLKPDKPYVFLSNHRDIILDTSLINMSLYETDKIMTASAIGDNLVQKPFLMALSKLNRNFLVQRNLPARELLKSSNLLSHYIQELLSNNQSVWLAHREGRTKDGDDRTQQGVLKMLAIARGKLNVMDYLKQLNMVVVAVSYEYDPTDELKIKELVAKEENVKYIKDSNEDFNSIIRGVTGVKKRIHLSLKSLPKSVFDQINKLDISTNDKLQMLTETIDHSIHTQYKLWPTNYIAYDLLNNTSKYNHAYTLEDKILFERRLNMRVKKENLSATKNFLKMYANPVVNKERLNG